MTAIAHFIVDVAAPELELVAKELWNGGLVYVQMIGERTVLALGWYSGGLRQREEQGRGEGG